VIPLVAAAFSLAVADLDGDELPDLMVGLPATRQVAVFRNTGSGTFAAPVNYVSDAPRSIIAADLNGDGHLDMLVASVPDMTCDCCYPPSRISVRLGLGDGTFSPETVFPTGYLAASMAIGDFDEDGRWDVMVAGPSAPNCLCQCLSGGRLLLLRGRGDGTFDSFTDMGPGTGPIAIADFDRDGHADLLVGPGSTEAITMRRGHGDGTFASAENYPVGDPVAVHGFEPIAIADMNGDGKVDVVIPNFYQYTVTVLKGLEDGSLSPPVAFGTLMPAGLAVGHINQDGRPDIVGANNFRDDVTLLLNDTPDFATSVIIAPADVGLGLEFSNPCTAGRLNASCMLRVRGSARLELIDVGGRTVWIRDLGHLDAGRHVFTVDLQRSLSSGVYVLRLNQSQRSVSRKLVLVH
jgi:hypothetical protein